MDHAVCRAALGLPAGYALDGGGAPVGAHVRKALRPARHELAKEHGQAVEVVVLRGHDHGLADAVPVKGGVEQRLHHVPVGEVVGPLALALEARGDGVVPAALLDKAHGGQLLVADHQVPGDHGHQDAGLQHLALLFRAVADLLGVLVPADADVFVHPGLGQLELLVVVDAFLPAADELDHVHLLHAHAEVLFQEGRVHDGARDAHGHAAHTEVALAAHRRHRKARPHKAQQLLLHVLGDGAVARVLHVMAVEGEGGEPLLVVPGQGRGQVHRARPLRAVEAPDRLRAQGVHVQRLRAVAPAGRHRHGEPHVFPRKLRLALRSLRNAADGRIRDHALHRQTARVLELGFDQRGHGLGHAHGLGLQPLADALAPAVDRRADAHLGQIAAQLERRIVSVKCLHCRPSYVHLCKFSVSPGLCLS